VTAEQTGRGQTGAYYAFTAMFPYHINAIYSATTYINYSAKSICQKQKRILQLKSITNVSIT